MALAWVIFPQFGNGTGITERGNNPFQSELKDLIWRADLGVVFSPVATLNNAGSSWAHVFRIPTIRALKFPDMPDLCGGLRVAFRAWDDPEDSDRTSPGNEDLTFSSSLLQVKKTNTSWDVDRWFRGNERSPSSRWVAGAKNSLPYSSFAAGQKLHERNYLFWQCKKYQETLPYIWQQIQVIDLSIRNNLRASRALLQENSFIEPPSSALDADVNDRNDRNRRAPEWVQKGAKWLFGVATERDIEKLSLCLKLLDYKLTLSEEQIKDLAVRLQTYSEEVNLKFQNVASALGKLREGQSNLARRLINVQRSLTGRIMKIERAYLIHGTLITQVIKLALQRLTLYQTYYTIVRERTAAIETLVTQGTLSPLLVPPEEIEAMYKQIERALRNEHPNYQITTRQQGFIYKTPGVIYSSDKNNLWVQVKVPVAAYDSRYFVYRPTSFELPTDNSTETFTKIINLPELFAVSFDNSFFFELTYKDLESCVGQNDQKYCLHSFPVTSKEMTTCTSSLFWKLYVDIRNKCKVQYIKSAKPVQYLEHLGDQVYLSVAQPNDVWHVTCGKNPPVGREPVRFGIVKIKCDCSLRSHFFFVPPSLESCHYTSISDIVSEPLTNLVYLAKWLDQEQVQPLFSKYESEPFDLQVPIPNITLPDFGEEYVSLDKNLVLDLDEVIQHHEGSKKLVSNAIHHVIKDLEESNKGSSSRGISIIVILIVLALIVVAVVVLYKKFGGLKGLSSSALASTFIPGANAIGSDVNIHKTTKYCFEIPDGVTTVFIIIIGCLTLYQAGKTLYKLYKRLQKHYLYAKYIMTPYTQEPLSILLEINTACKTAYLLLTKVHTSPGSLLVKDPALRVTVDHRAPCCEPHIDIAWFNTDLKMNPGNRSIPLPERLKLGLITSILIKRILADPKVKFSLLAGIHNKFTYIPIEGGTDSTGPNLVQGLVNSDNSEEVVIGN